jgi:hypothetical protein
MFTNGTLVTILLTQVFLFYERQFAAVVGLLLNVLLLGALQAALDFEGESGEREVENAVGVRQSGEIGTQDGEEGLTLPSGRHADHERAARRAAAADVERRDAAGSRHLIGAGLAGHLAPGVEQLAHAGRTDRVPGADQPAARIEWRSGRRSRSIRPRWHAKIHRAASGRSDRWPCTRTS